MRVKLLIIAALLFTSCAQDRPLKKVPENALRHPKQVFDGEFVYLKSVVGVDAPGKTNAWVPPGLHLSTETLVRFEIRDTELLVVALHAAIQEKRPATQPTVIAKFPIRRVDVVRKQNADGHDTHEEEQTEDRREPKERSHVLFEASGADWDPLDVFAPETRHLSPPQAIVVDANDGAINLELTRRLADETLLRVRYSFAPFRGSTYEPRQYSRELEQSFGFFKTMPADFDRYGRVTVSHDDAHQLINRRDPQKPAIYYFAPEFPNHLKPMARDAFDRWNQQFLAANGKPLLEIRENSGQQLGDVRFNLLVYDHTPYSVHGVLGYGPTLTHPVTGEILKGDVMFYGGTIRRAILHDRLWAGEFGDIAENPDPPPPKLQKDRRLIPMLARHFHRPSGDAFGAGSSISEGFVAWSVSQLAGFARTYSPVAAQELLRKEALHPLSHHTTRMSDTVEDTIKKLYEDLARNDAEVEAQVFAPLVLHEVGHNLGLRHNFKASADVRKSKVSSVMDYAFLSSREPQHPGGYDTAAIQVAYGPVEQRRAALDQKFLFCTDHEVYTSVDPMCAHFDRGDTLFQLVQAHKQRYRASHVFNNLRLDRRHFEFEPKKDYLKKVLSHLLPLRLIHDHADAIVRASATRDNASLWYLLRHRIEATAKTLTKDRISVKVKAGENLSMEGKHLANGYRTEERVIDAAKLSGVLADADLARLEAFTTLVEVIFDKSEDRPNYDETDEVRRQVQVRGVLPDKLIALLLLGIPTPDPLARKNSISPFTSLADEGTRDLFIALISDFPPLDSHGGLRKKDLDSLDYDFNLRHLAALLIRHHLGVPGASPAARDLLRIQKLHIPTNGEIAARRRLRDELHFRDDLACSLGGPAKEITREEIHRIMMLQFPTPTVALQETLDAIVGKTNSLPKEKLAASNASALTDLNKNLDRIEQNSSRVVANLFLQDDVRESIRHAYRNFYRIGLKLGEMSMSVDEASGLVMKAEMARPELDETYLPLPNGDYLHAEQRLQDTSRETAAGYLLRDNVARREDRWMAIHGLLLAEQRRVRDTATPEDISRVTALQKKVDEFEQRYLAERAFAESLQRLFDHGDNEGQSDLTEMMQSIPE